MNKLPPTGGFLEQLRPMGFVGGPFLVGSEVDGRRCTSVVLHDLACPHVVDVAGAEQGVRFSQSRGLPRVVVNRDFRLAHNFELIALHDDGGVFGNTNAEKVGIPFWMDGNQVVPAVTHVDVLVDCGPSEELEPFLMIRLVPSS